MSSTADIVRDVNSSGTSGGSGPIEITRTSPVVRSGTVPREALLARLTAATSMRVITIAAPAGYGKTTLLSQWIDADERKFAFVNVDESTNDPFTLMHLIADALARAGAITIDSRRDAASSVEPSHVAAEIVRSLQREDAPVVIVLDHLEALRSRAANDALASLVAQLPDGATLALASRKPIRLPLSVYRPAGLLLELTTTDLAMDAREVRLLLEAEGVEAQASIESIVDQTEGWPIAAYLVAVALSSGASIDSVLDVRGTDRLVTDYLRRELFGNLSRARRDFLMRTSILDRLCGESCDDLLQTSGSADLLETLAVSNLLVIPMDRTREWYRYHHLFKRFLRDELSRCHADEVVSLHQRASLWFERNGLAAEAIRHAQLADDDETAIRLVATQGRRAFSTGRITSVLSWLDWFDGRESLPDHSDFLALGAICYGLVGDVAPAERWSGVILNACDEKPSEETPPVSIVRAAMCGVRGVVDDSYQPIVPSLPPDSGWYPAAALVDGLMLLWHGEGDTAERVLRLAYLAGERYGAPSGASMARGVCASIALDRGEHLMADDLARGAVDLVRSHGLERLATSGIPFAVAARTALRLGQCERAAKLRAEASTVRPSLTRALPGIAFHTLLELATADMQASDFAGARQVLRQVRDITAEPARFGSLSATYRDLLARLETLPVGGGGASTLTTAELRVLPYLATHLSFVDIGERLFVSRNTAKTHAISIYRKLDVTSRSDAVDAARRLGLLAE